MRRIAQRRVALILLLLLLSHRLLRLLALLLPAMLRLLSLLLGLSPAPGRWPSVAGVQDSGMQLDFPTG